MSRQLQYAVFLLLLLLAAGARAQFTNSVCADPSQSMLWEVVTADAAPRIHLLGSIHVGKAGFYPLHTEVEQRFQAADHIVFEVDPQAAADPAIAMQLQLRGMLSAGQSLADVLGPALLDELRQVLQSLGIPPDNFMQYKPWMVALLLSNLQAGTLGYDPAYGLESYLLRQRPPHSDILELESLEQQLAMLESLHAETFLAYSLYEFGNGRELMESMVAAWRCADHEALSALVRGTGQLDAAGPESRGQLEAIHQALFTQRNIRMADGIEAWLRGSDESYFVVVGAGHLLGDDSVVEVLRQRGHTLRQVLLSP